MAIKNTVKDLMQANPVIVSPDATLQEAAAQMRSIDCGCLPVGTRDRVEGVITDRDIVLRAVASGTDPAAARVRDHMTPNVCFCSESDTPEHAAELMRDNGVSRLLVQDAAGRVCGILTFGRILREDGSVREIMKVIESAVGKKAA
ncbi:MAG: CBS domain-containing protein [Bdellovibrionales bacterium]